VNGAQVSHFSPTTRGGQIQAPELRQLFVSVWVGLICKSSYSEFLLILPVDESQSAVDGQLQGLQFG